MYILLLFHCCLIYFLLFFIVLYCSFIFYLCVVFLLFFILVLEFGSGGNLMMGHGMEDLQPLPDPVLSKNYFKDVVTGLAYMHSHNIIHRGGILVLS
jgi:serine/threonine protein kinase